MNLILDYTGKNIKIMVICRVYYCISVYFMNTFPAQFKQSLSVSTLGSYIHWVNTIPMLTLEEEQEHAASLQKEDNIESAQKLILSHLRLVVKIARGYSGYGLSQEDLIQEGNIGLMKAVKRFDPKVGVRLVSFAIHWIRAEIHEFVLKNWRIVKMATTKAQRKLFFNLRKKSKARNWFSPTEVKTIAEELNVPASEVTKMESRLYQFDESIDKSSQDEKEGIINTSLQNSLKDSSKNPELLLEHQDWSNSMEAQLRDSISSLDERSQYIIQQRWLVENKQTLHQLADYLNVSAERIRQIEKNAMNKIKSAINLQ